MVDEQFFFRKMQEGDWTAFNFFFKEHMEQLYLYAFAFVKERGVAEDIVQEVFIYLWTNRERISCTGSVFSYLMRAVKNACINYKEHLEVEQRYQREMLLCSGGVAEEPDDLEEVRRKVLETIDKLPPKCREIFILGCVEGLKYKEIAGQLDVSVNTVKIQMKFAYRKIKADVGTDAMLACVLIFGLSEFFLEK